jgi:hypothetical protein
MKHLIPIFALAVTLIGCAHGARPAKPSVMEREASLVTKHAEGQLVSMNCSDMRVTNAAGDFTLNAGACGLLHDSLMAKGELKSEICPELGLSGKACDQKVRETFLARARSKYAKSDEKVIERFCQSYPTKCVSARDMEVVLLNVHNEAVFAELKGNLDTVIARQGARDEQAAAERKQRISQGLQQMSKSLRPKPSATCVSQNTPLGVETRCQQD